MDPRTEKAFDFASETTKQLITLATGVLALTVTFAKDVIGSVSTTGIWLLGISWALYILSLIAGIMTLGCLTGELGQLPAAGSTAAPPSIYSKSVKSVAIAQCGLFLVATILIVVFAIVSLVAPPKKDSGAAACPCLKNAKP